MATAATSLLGLALPVQGELSGTWGDTVNNSITALLDTAVAGTTTLSTDADVTLTSTQLASNQARAAILLWTAGGTVTRVITAPAQSKPYIVINKTSSTQSITLVGAGPTTGITLVAGETVIAAWNGSDFVKVATSYNRVANGGTGLFTLTAGRIPYGAGTSAFGNTDNLSYDGTTLRVGSNTLLGGATNPIVGMTGSQNNFIQSYVYNAASGTSASSDFVAYANGSSDVKGWADLGFTGTTYADAVYTVTGPNEAYIFGSSTSTSYTGNLVYATDSTGSANAHQFYVGGFTQAKGAWKFQITSTGVQVADALTVGGVAVPTISSTSTLTNKRVNPRVQAVTSDAGTYDINTNSYDMVVITSQTVAISSVTTSGTPVNGQKLWLAVTSTNTSIAFSSTYFEASGTVPLPTTLTSGTRLDIGFVYNATTTKWRCVATA
jgi:hypothetical protein